MIVKNVKICCSLGDVCDRLSILQLKHSNCDDKNKFIPEIKSLISSISKVIKIEIIENNEYYQTLSLINKLLWDAVDKERQLLSNNKDVEFATRLVCFLNDQRNKYKQKINDAFLSDFVESKIYK